MFLLLGMVFWISKEENKVEPFDTVGIGDKNLSGGDISALFLIDLNQIYDAYKSTSFSISNQSISDQNKNKMREISISNLTFPNDRLERFEIGMGTLGMGGSSFSIGNTLLFMRGILRGCFGRGDTVISGRLQRYGSIISIEAILTDNTNTVAREVNLTLDKDAQSVAEYNIPSLVNDLAFKIAYVSMGQSPELKKELPHTFLAFKNLTEGLIAFNKYSFTNDTNDLNQSKTLLLSIRHTEPSAP